MVDGGGWVNQAYSRLSTTHGHITDCKFDSVVYVAMVDGTTKHLDMGHLIFRP